jgi:hypothetical protein
MESSWRDLEVQVNYARTKSIIVQTTWELARCKLCAQRTNLVCVCVFAYTIHTYLLTPWSRVLLEKLSGFAASQEIPRIYGTRKFITVLTSALHLSLSNGLLPSGVPTKILCTPLPSPTRATCPVHLILLDFTTCTILGKEYAIHT